MPASSTARPASTGRDPVGISTQDDELASRFDPVLGGRKIAAAMARVPLAGTDWVPGVDGRL